MNCVISFSLVTKHVFDLRTNVLGFWVLQEIFVYQMYVPFDPLKCGAFHFLQEIFMYRTYVPCHLPIVGLSAFYRKFSCIGHTYHFIHQVWGFPHFVGNFHALDVRTISTTKCGAFCKKFSCIGRTYHFIHQVWGFPLFAGNFCECNVFTMANWQ